MLCPKMTSTKLEPLFDHQWTTQFSASELNPDIHKVLKERDLWWERKSSKRWTSILDAMPEKRNQVLNLQGPFVASFNNNVSPSEQKKIEELATELIPWKKGPFSINGLEIDAEWRSDQKWERFKQCLPNLKEKKVLDIGCNNGYFLFKMAQMQATLLLGIDPVLPFATQFHFIQNFAQAKNTYFELLGVEHLESFKNSFHLILFMGIIYHHRHPIKQLIDIREALAPGGQVILETIGIPGKGSMSLFPEDRYARMSNVWFVPTLDCFINWAKKAKLIDVEVIEVSELTEQEQRLTKWCPPPRQSLMDGLDPNNHKLTIEGHPAPQRFLLSARKKGS